MRVICLWLPLYVVLFGASPALANSNADGKSAPSSFFLVLDTFTGSSPLHNGMEIHQGQATMQVLALRDDVLRVRIARDGTMPEDSSWAVLDSARRQQVQVVHESNQESAGFRTKALRVSIDRKTLRLAIADLQGNVLQEDAPGWPVEFHGQSFRIFKKMPLSEHYFGLGDKTGPLDRRGEAFTLWNTDSYNFQESTDPLYKSIPFFIALREGSALGVLFDNTWRSSFDFGKQIPNVYSFGAENGPVDYYLL